MQIHWFPGHMNKARRQIKEVMPKIDVMIEVLDARLPLSSTNQLLAELREDKPVLKVLSKSDLADPEVTRQWQSYLNEQLNTDTLAIRTDQPHLGKTIPARCKKLAPTRGSFEKPVRAMICGIPNVGKSTLINLLAGRKMANVGNEPAVTKRQQKVLIEEGFELMDTPGIMNPSPKDELSGYRLAASGAIRDTAMEYEDVAMFAADYLLQRYPEKLSERFKVTELPETSYDFLEVVARKRGCLKKGGFDLHRVSEIFLNELRDGKLGLISLEQPDREYPYRDLEAD